MFTIARDYLEELLKTSSVEPISDTLNYLSKTRSETEFLGVFSESSAEKQQRNEILDVALSLRSALISEDLAKTRISTTDFSRVFLYKNSFNGEYSSDLVNIQRLLAENLREHQRSIADLNRQTHLKEESEKELNLLKTQYSLIKDDLSELFSLERKMQKDAGGFSLYTSGVLAGLPVISNIPDGLSDLVALRGSLELAGGRVKIEGDDAHTVFTQKLLQIQQLCTEISSKYSSLNQLLETTNQQLLSLKAERQERRKRTISTLNHLILVLSDI